MTDADRLRLAEQLQRHEGVRLKPYQDTAGKWTIGCGRNLSDRGISEEESDYLQGNDMNAAEDDCLRTFPWFRDLDSVRQAALVNLCFNLGLTRLLGFVRMLTAMSLHRYEDAADEVLDSVAARKAPGRYAELAGMVRSGEWRQ